MEQQEAEKYIFNQALSSSDRDYVMELTTYGLPRLEKEPEYLLSEKNRINKEMEDVTVSNLSIFLQTSNTVSESRKLVHSMQSHVDNTISIIPSLLNKSNTFSFTTRSLRNKRKSNRLIVSNQMRVSEILELPQLMWKCARAKLYRSALDLQLYAVNLYNRNPSILILNKLIKEMNKTQKYILNELLNNLEKSILLPDCLAIIGYLRRMNVFDNELLLRKEFLMRRLKYLHTKIPAFTSDTTTDHDNNDNDECYDYLSKFMDIYRKNIFAIVTQYKAIFVDTFNQNQIKYDDNKKDDDDVSILQQKLQIFKQKHVQPRSFICDLLVIWVHKRIIHIVSTIERLLPYITSGSFLNSLAETCDICGTSLAHVGMDFRGLLPPIFEKQIVNLWKNNCNTAILQFQSALTSHDWFITVELLSNIINDDDGDDDGDDDDGIRVPPVLLQYPPLAVLTNAYIKSFNELREFVTYTVMIDCKNILINTIQSTVNCIRKFSVSSHHYHSHSHSSSIRKRNRKRKRRLSKYKKKQQIINDNNDNKMDVINIDANDKSNLTAQRRKSMNIKPVTIDKDINDNKDGGDNDDDDDNDLYLDNVDDEIDEVLSSLVKVECEYLLPFICDLFDKIFERTNEIKIDDLLEYFVGLYEIPKLNLSDNDDDDDINIINDNNVNNDIDNDHITDVSQINVSNANNSNSITKTQHEPNKSMSSNPDFVTTIVNNDVDDDAF